MKENLSPYVSWITVGIVLGYHLVKHPKKKRMFIFVDKDGEFKPHLSVHESGVKSCINKNLIEERETNPKTKYLGLTPTGFEFAMRRIKASSVQLTTI